MLIFHPVPVATDSDDEDGHLAFHAGRLVAVFVRLDSPEHREERGRLHLEASFGALCGLPARTFASLEEAAPWLTAQLEGGRGFAEAGFSIAEPVGPEDGPVAAHRSDRTRVALIEAPERGC